jgi:hypothetical protein
MLPIASGTLPIASGTLPIVNDTITTVNGITPTIDNTQSALKSKDPKSGKSQPVLPNEPSLNLLPIFGKSHCPEPNQQSPASLERDTCYKLDVVKSRPLEGATVGKRIADDSRCKEVTGTGNLSTDEGHLQAVTGSTWEPKYISMWKKIYPTDPNLSFAIDIAKHTKDEANKEFKYINEVLYRKEKTHKMGQRGHHRRIS